MFFFKQKTAYEMRISDWSSDVCSSDLHDAAGRDQRRGGEAELVRAEQRGDRDVTPRAQAAVRLHADAAAQVVEQQRLLGLGQADLPGRSGVGERRQRRSAGAAFVAGDRARKSVGSGRIVSARVDLGGRVIIKQKKQK